jgi:hypothetical protein
MASRWFYRVFDQEMGPVGFQDLTEMVRTGTLTEDDRVRREFSEEWTPAREVIGLFRAAQKPAVDAKPSAADATPTTPEPKPPQPQAAPAGPARAPGRWRLPRFGARVWIGLAIGLVVAAIVGYELWSHRRSRIFPESALNKPRPVDKQAFESVRAPRPSVPSVPGLKEGVATLVPGLEQIDRVHSACLTPDLRTIVFAAKSKPECDLFIATRDNVSAPFGEPERIDACSTPKGAVYPTLSPDGLELMYMSWLEPQYLFHAVRESTSSEFAKPKDWLIPGVNPKTERVVGPRFLDLRHVFFLIMGNNFVVRRCFMAERAGPNGDFGTLRPMKTGPGACGLLFIVPESPRGYFRQDDGLHVIVRPNQDVVGGENMLVAPTKATGSIDGHIWVAPQEDVVFYNSTGPGKDPKGGPNNEGKKLWMFRF